jgi:Gram-negative bacterial TonB protein C-terminal
MRIRSNTAIGVYVALFVVPILNVSPTPAQQPRYPAFTLVTVEKNYDPDGNVIFESQSTVYNSSNGSWRAVSNGSRDEVATVYRRRKGVYYSSSRRGVQIKMSDHAPGCPSITAEELRGDSKFKRIEIVAGLRAYVLSERMSAAAYTLETYYAPEIGKKPLKQVYTIDDGSRIVIEPKSITFGEPSSSDVSGPILPIVEELPTSIRDLEGKVIFKLPSIYPAENRIRGLSGIVPVHIVIDEAGTVISARANGIILSLNEPAEDAAYGSLFSPTVVNGRPVKVEGSIFYQFDIPPAKRN